MLYVGSDDGVYRLRDDGPSENDAAAETRATKVLESGRVMRLRRFDDHKGTFAATRTGLHRTLDGEEWTDCGVPREQVYAVGTDPSGERLYAGTKPAHVYVTDAETAGSEGSVLEWRELEEFQRLPSREEWRLPRHENLAQVRDLLADPATAERVVAGVEVGGVHASDDGGETWAERRDGLHDDVHELHIVGPGEYVAATGDGCYRTTDAGRSWSRLDRGVRQTYFRRAFSIDGVVYASGALANSSTWDDTDADPALFSFRGEGSLTPLELPSSHADETVTGMTALEGDLVVATHRGNLFARRGDGWDVLGSFPVTENLTGRYTPVETA